jgi:hypothetical protein
MVRAFQLETNVDLTLDTLLKQTGTRLPRFCPSLALSPSLAAPLFCSLALLCACLLSMEGLYSPRSLIAACGAGVQYFKLDVPNHEAELKKMCAERGYTYNDFVTISPTTLPNYEEKIKNFFAEHLHKDEEIRLCLEARAPFLPPAVSR